MEKLENVINQVLILKINWHQKKNNYNVNIIYYKIIKNRHFLFFSILNVIL